MLHLQVANKMLGQSEEDIIIDLTLINESDDESNNNSDSLVVNPKFKTNSRNLKTEPCSSSSFMETDDITTLMDFIPLTSNNVKVENRFEQKRKSDLEIIDFDDKTKRKRLDNGDTSACKPIFSPNRDKSTADEWRINDMDDSDVIFVGAVAKTVEVEEVYTTIKSHKYTSVFPKINTLVESLPENSSVVGPISISSTTSTDDKKPAELSPLKVEADSSCLDLDLNRGRHFRVTNASTIISDEDFSRISDDANTLADVSEILDCAESTSLNTSDGFINDNKPEPVDSSKLRPVIIDGQNVALAHGHNKTFSEMGIRLVTQYFGNRGHKQIKVFLPSNYRNRAQYAYIQELESKEMVVFTPSRIVNNKVIRPYLDRYMLEYAQTNGGVIVSKDRFSDLYNEKKEWKKIIEERLLEPVFVDDLVMFPQDPLGRFGPTLSEFLRLNDS